jgi:lipopolysaccharide/colanic/teichoic acid biosynthesis glycosyltransferase
MPYSETAAVATAPHRSLYLGDDRVDAIFRRRVSASAAFRATLALKRLFDILFSGLLLLALSPVIAAAFLAVRLTSKGPFLFSQPRWGLDETHFQCYKMRSMYVDANARLAKPQSEEDKQRGILQKMKNDPRVTPVGAFLRRTSIDELPQLWNVFRGDMSVVGPRPLMIHMMQPYDEIRAVRSVVRPGLTGLWQIRHRANNTSVLQMIDDDAEYILNLSLLLDLKTLCATPGELLRGTGAH